MANNSMHVSVGFPWMMILLVIFIALKVAGVIAWSWWAVFMPVIIPIVIIWIIFLLCGLVIVVGVACDGWNKK